MVLDMHKKIKALTEELNSQEVSRTRLLELGESNTNQRKLDIDEINSKINSLEVELHNLESRLTSCCKNSTHIGDIVNKLINEKVTAGEFTDNLVALLGKYFMSKSETEDIYLNIEQSKRSLKEEIVNFIDVNHKGINSDVLVEDLLKQLKEKEKSAPGGLGEKDVALIVQNALIQYDADKTGLFDFALETAGGSVISTRCTETYVQKSGMYSLFGIPIWYPSNNPRTIIQPGVLPGECWAFKGSSGYIVIQLSEPILPNQFSLEHISKSMSPSGRIDSAPREFNVLGLQSEKDKEPVLLGEYVYVDDANPLQFFPVQFPPDKAFLFIELDVKSNHGNINYTCIYRFRVHGTRD